MGDPNGGGPDVPEQASKLALWKEFFRAHHIARDSVPLFATSPDGAVEITRMGRSATPLLRRPEPMDAGIGGAVADILRARPMGLEGLLYLMRRWGLRRSTSGRGPRCRTPSTGSSPTCYGTL